jgi:glutaredoxin-like YruB-family protein
MLQTLKKLAPFFIFFAVIVINQNWWRISLAIDPIDTQLLSNRDVLIYTTSWCPYCRKVKRYFRAAGIPYTEFDVEKSEAAFREYERISGRGVPVIKIGSTVINGYDTNAIRGAIDHWYDARELQQQLTQ